ncbi:hypothetical protein HMPREF9180_1382 [Streptococcus peroris ATCC 700780]|uniref:Uncharacterized protein n=1 Tax=Streptococcus peroris ATCC 700780 TaxID=888746 RepID=E8KD27_9STRE|nr:hypothetical protein HMPREF9180_1382 [Streptococcus peroris ATCC 700780]
METQVVWETVSAQLPETGESWKVRGTFLPQLLELERVGRFGDVFSPALENKNRQ